MVLGPQRAFICSLAKGLAQDNRQAEQIRAAASLPPSGERPKEGGILEALRRSPLVGADLHTERPGTAGRRADL